MFPNQWFDKLRIECRAADPCAAYSSRTQVTSCVCDREHLANSRAASRRISPHDPPRRRSLQHPYAPPASDANEPMAVHRLANRAGHQDTPNNLRTRAFRARRTDFLAPPFRRFAAPLSAHYIHAFSGKNSVNLPRTDLVIPQQCHRFPAAVPRDVGENVRCLRSLLPEGRSANALSKKPRSATARAVPRSHTAAPLPNPGPLGSAALGISLTIGLNCSAATRSIAANKSRV